MRTAALLTCLSMTLVAAGQKTAVDPVYPAGSTTYFQVSTVWSRGPLETSVMPATPTNCKRLQRALLELARPPKTEPADAPVARGESTPAVEAEASKSDEPRPLATFLQHYTITVWSDGRIEHGPVQTLTQASLDSIRARAEEVEPCPEKYVRVVKPPPQLTIAPNVTPSSQYKAGDRCHATTAAGSRCSRLAKGTTGFCYQHQAATDNTGE